MKKRKSGEITDWFPQLIIAVIAAVAAVVLAYYLAIKPKPPQFIIETPIVKVGEPIIIKAANKEANCNKALNVEFDKHIFENAGEPFRYDNDSKQRWRFNIMKVGYTPEMIRAGAHKMRFGFKEEDFCKEEQAVSFSFKCKTRLPVPLVLRGANIEGFYKAPEDEFGALITLTIEKVDKKSKICTFKYILAGIEGIDPGTGSLNFSRRAINIPGLGEGKVSLNRENKFILNFIYKGREVQFVQSNI
ncbi:MAG: hypothetical protein PVH61_13405 [Candidatus Aminicenantes bacterium]|jgi:hypothetical protein